jgi:hypothetical protein
MKKFKVTMWAKFLVAFFGLLGIKIKKSRAKKALKFAEVFFKKFDKKQRRRSKNKASFKQSLRWKLRAMLRDRSIKTRLQIIKRAKKDRAFYKACRSAIKANDTAAMNRLVRSVTAPGGRPTTAAPMKQAA